MRNEKLVGEHLSLGIRDEGIGISLQTSKKMRN